MADDDDQKVDAEKVVGFEGEAHAVSYNKRDLLLYALGIGCKNTSDELPFLYEDHEQFAAFPTFPLVLPFKGTSHDVVPFPGPTLAAFPPGLPIVNPAMILHAEQSIQILKPLSPDGGELEIRGKIVGLYDKGKGALMRDETRFIDSSTGEVVAVAVGGSFIRGLTGFEGKGPKLPDPLKPPSREPDQVVEEATSDEQALAYRLSGDYNTLHADPEVAQAVGFERPILHGLCTFGHAARAVLSSFANNDPSRLRSISARFSKPTFPGETLVTSMWKLDDRRIAFRTEVKERGVRVLDLGLAEIGEAGEGPAKAKL